MSVLIKGMKMPENCGECIWIQRGYPDWCDLPMGKDLYNDKKRPDWCPLVEVSTPHGRLIDADELERFMYHHAFELDSADQQWDSGCWVRYRLFENAMKAMPTIIEAEGGAEE